MVQGGGQDSDSPLREYDGGSTRPRSVALVHHLLLRFRGGERVLEALMETYPEAPVYTLLAAVDGLPESFEDRRIVSSWMSKIPGATRLYKAMLPIVPAAFESFDLSEHDLVISSDSMLAKGVVTGSETFHACYCHSPPRYLWDLAGTYRREEVPTLLRPFWDMAASKLRTYDVVASQRVDHFFANSSVVRDRISKHYGREAEVVHPPVDTEFFTPGGGEAPRQSEEYVYAGELVAYKRPDLLVDAFRGDHRRLRILGRGPLLGRLKRSAPPNVSVEGFQSAEGLREAFRTCRALVFAGVEDFGITLVEAQACGAPVVALGRGGAVDCVQPGVTGLFFHEQSVPAIREALDRFEDTDFDAAKIRRHAERFGKKRFQEEIRISVEQRYREWLQGRPP